ncbi:MAG: hypothetical protein KJ638_05525 [Chloroflexi bacterium]|nr:hypothetical protein [Chloroflexota bacterium]
MLLPPGLGGRGGLNGYLIIVSEWNKKMLQATYCFFDAPFVLESDDPDFLTNFDRAYHHFRITTNPASTLYQVTLTGEPKVNINGKTVRSANPGALRQYAYSAILNAVTAQVRSHFLFHAASVGTRDGQGMILAGEAGMGKTTLTLALLQRKFHFLSDDVAAVGRSDSWLDPFPRSLGVRLGDSRPGEKHLVDVDDLAPEAPHSLVAKSGFPLRFLFVLSETKNKGEEPDCYLVLDHTPSPLLARLRAIANVRETQTMRGKPYPVVRLRLEPGTLPTVEPEIEKICRRHQVLLFEITRGREAPPDFSSHPKLVPLSASEAARELLHHFKGGPRSALLQQDFGSSATRLYLALAGLTAGMACYRLNVGRLEEMVEMIINTVEHRS